MAAFSQVLSIILVILLVWVPPVCGQSSAAAPVLQLEVVSGGERPQVSGHTQSQGISVRAVDAQARGVADVAVTFQLPDQDVSGTFPGGSRTLSATTDSQGLASATGIQWDAMAGIASIRITATKGTAHVGLILRQELVWPVQGAPPHVASTEAAKPPAPGTLPAPAARNAAPNTPAGLMTPGVEIVTKKPPTSSAVPYSSESPDVTISNSGSGGSSSKKKWIVICVIAGVAGGVAVAMLSKKSTSSATTASSPTANTIGSPTISIGPP